jgi:hypothetical protein
VIDSLISRASSPRRYLDMSRFAETLYDHLGRRAAASAIVVRLNALSLWRLMSGLGLPVGQS